MALIFSAPAGPRNVPTGEAPGGPSRRTRNPGNEVLLRSPRGGRRSPTGLVEIVAFLRPCRGGKTAPLTTGYAADRLWRPALHPWLHAFAPPGQGTARTGRSRSRLSGPCIHSLERLCHPNPGARRPWDSWPRRPCHRTAKWLKLRATGPLFGKSLKSAAGPL